MAAKSSAQQAHALLNLYIDLYEEKYKKAPSLNRYKEKWAMQDVIDSVGYVRAQELIKYYFTLSKAGHPLTHFLFNFEKIDYLQKEIEKDKEHRVIVRALTKKMVEERESQISEH